MVLAGLPVEFKRQQPRLPHRETRTQRRVIVIVLIATDFTERNRRTGLSEDEIGHQRAGDRKPPLGFSALSITQPGSEL